MIWRLNVFDIFYSNNFSYWDGFSMVWDSTQQSESRTQPSQRDGIVADRRGWSGTGPWPFNGPVSSSVTHYRFRWVDIVNWYSSEHTQTKSKPLAAHSAYMELLEVNSCVGDAEDLERLYTWWRLKETWTKTITSINSINFSSHLLVSFCLSSARLYLPGRHFATPPCEEDRPTGVKTSSSSTSIGQLIHRIWTSSIPFVSKLWPNRGKTLLGHFLHSGHVPISTG